MSGPRRFRGVGYAYPTSFTAIALGHEAKGCFYSCYRDRGGHATEHRLEGFASLESAVRDAVRQYPELSWSPGDEQWIADQVEHKTAAARAKT